MTFPKQAATGDDIYRLVSDLYPICRSITGEGLRDTLRRIQEIVPLTILEVPSGTPVFDWTVPREWTIREAYIRDLDGNKVVDFRDLNLHVVQYSTSIHRRIPLADLRSHLFTLPDHPDWVPYRTSYYKESWGFCLSQRQFDLLQDEEYEVCINSSLDEGSLTYGELYLPGQSDEEILISCHACHPSLCNDNLAGVAIAAFLAHHMSRQARRYAYRFLFIPGTIGSITWLSRNEEKLSQIRHGLVLSCLGDAGNFSYKKSRLGNAEIDRAVTQVLKHSGRPYQIQEFSPYGYDERQYCSPGFNLPVGRFSRTPNGCYPEYHTSADNLEFVKPVFLAESLHHSISIVNLLERNNSYVNLNPKCEPQLGRRGLYRSIGGLPDAGTAELAMLWVLNLSDGQNSLLDISERSNLNFEVIHDAAELLKKHGLLRDTAESAGVR